LANYDNLTVKCNDVSVINQLTAEDTGIKGLWFTEKHKSANKPNECYLTVRNGVKWLEALERMSKDLNEIINVEIAFDADWHLVNYNLVIKDGAAKLLRVRVDETWWDIKGSGLTIQQAKEIKAACKQITSDSIKWNKAERGCSNEL
jgi:hypothetical protein